MDGAPRLRPSKPQLGCGWKRVMDANTILRHGLGQERPRAASSKERGQPRFANPTRFTLEFSDAANLGRVGRQTKTTRSWNATNASRNAMSGKARSTSEDDTALAREMLWLPLENGPRRTIPPLRQLAPHLSPASATPRTTLAVGLAESNPLPSGCHLNERGLLGETACQ